MPYPTSRAGAVWSLCNHRLPCAQRSVALAAVIDAGAEALLFDDASFEAGVATFTVHPRRDLEQGWADMGRVLREPMLIASCDPLASKTSS